MALTAIPQPPHPFDRLKDNRPNLPPPPPVAITPAGDPWPRPYCFERGLRRVAPYHFTYNTYCKQRWRGREILNVFAEEFRDRPREYYKGAIEAGGITINGKPVYDIHTIIKNGDIISHTLHRHEPPVTAQPVKVISEDDDMIVIDKPAGVPVHPTGRYTFNSVTEIMRAERNHSFNPMPVNRLDRLTSGVMFIGKTSTGAVKFSNKLRDRTVRKEYVARVKGRFADGEGWDGDEQRGGVVTCNESILQISPVVGLNRARATGRRAKTLFRRIAYYPPINKEQGQRDAVDNNIHDQKDETSLSMEAIPGVEDEGYSIVHCLPLTGRTHQIRVHLQFQGHPITNDPIYSNRKVFGAALGKGDATPDLDEELIQRLRRMGNTELADAVSYEKEAATLNGNTPQVAKCDDEKTVYKNFKQTLHAGPLPDNESEDRGYADPVYGALVKAHDADVEAYERRKGERLTGELCDVCGTGLYSDPSPQELGIYLHAIAYSDLDGSWSYRSPMPQWALPPAGMTGPTEVLQWQYDGSEVLDFDEDEERKSRNQQGAKLNKAKGS